MDVEKCCGNLRVGICLFGFILAKITLLCLPLYGMSIKNREMDGFDILIFIVIIVTFINRCLLVYGAYKEIRGYILAYLIIEGIFISISTVLNFFLIFQGLVFFGDFIILAILGYFWYCVLTFYRKLGLVQSNYEPNQLSNFDQTVYIDLQNEQKQENIVAASV